MRAHAKIAGLALVALGVLEGIARLSHLADTPLYVAHSEIGYIPVPNQSGNFMRTNDWVFNNRSMGTSRHFDAKSSKGILLIGDSIVLGGNPYKQEERLAPQIEVNLKTEIWPISAGSWSLQNELAYLRLNPDVAKPFDQVAIVLNSEDFGDPSFWKSDITHPRHIYFSYAAYILNRYVFGFDPDGFGGKNPVAKRDNFADFKQISEQLDRPVYIFLYPTKMELVRSDPCDFAPEWIMDVYVNNVSCIASSSEWNSGMYRDTIHPTVEGTKILARIISDHLSIYSIRDWK